MGILPFSFKNTTGRCSFHVAFAGLLLLLMLSANIQSGNYVRIEASPSGWGNGTTSTVEDEYVTTHEDQEFLVDYEFMNNLLPANPDPFTYPALQKGPVCSTTLYRKCLPTAPRTERTCSFANFCEHSPH